jgi:hypothetical protein
MSQQEGTRDLPGFAEAAPEQWRGLLEAVRHLTRFRAGPGPSIVT